MKKPILFLTILTLAACAHAPAEPVVDMRGVEYGQYQADLNECRGYAEQIDAPGTTAEGVAAGAVGGAVIGAILGMIVRNPAAGAALGAAAGGAGGGAGGLTASMVRKNHIMNQCLINRGYHILG